MDRPTVSHLNRYVLGIKRETRTLISRGDSKRLLNFAENISLRLTMLPTKKPACKTTVFFSRHHYYCRLPRKILLF